MFAIHNPDKVNFPFFIWSGQDQYISMSSNFNNHVMRICINVCKDQEITELIIVAADGVRRDRSFINSALCEFLLGGSYHVGLVDININGKDFRCQLLVGSSVVIMGHHVFYTIMFRLQNVCKDLWHVKYFASDLLVLTLYYPDSVEKLSTLVDEYQGEFFVLCDLLYFLWARIFSVNRNILVFRERITFIWSSMILFPSFTYLSDLGSNYATIVANMRNIVTETITFVFLLVRD